MNTFMGWLWPFPTRSSSQYGRIDQGWDIDEAAGAPILAIADGVVGKSRPAPSKGSFGVDYPWLQLDALPPGGPSDTVYYGHAHVDPAVVGTHVTAGTVIGHTNTQAEAAAQGTTPGHLEIGFARHDSGSPVDPLVGGMGAGTRPGPSASLMRSLLMGSHTAAGGVTPGPPAANAAGTGTATATNVSLGSATKSLGRLGSEIVLVGLAVVLIAAGAYRTTQKGRAHASS